MITAGARVRAWVGRGSVLDAALALALTAMCQAQLPADESLWVRLSLLAVLVVAVRRRWPLGATLVLAAAVALQGLSADPPATFGLFLAVMLLMFTVAADCEIGAALAGGLALAAGVVAHDVNSAEYGTAAGMASDLAIPVILWFVGRGVRIQRRRADRAGELLARLEADRDELARLAVAAERRHLARELHDVVTHSVTVVVIQAQGAQRALTGEPAEQALVSKALADIEAAGRSALAEMRRLLGVLREDEADGAQARPPALTDLPDLVARVRRAGLAVELVSAGTPAALDPAVELTAYRVVQEALTNALRHADRSTVRVTLAWADGALALDVVDTGAGADVGGEPSEPSEPSESSGGRGLLGLAERVRAHGGELRTGTTAEGGHHVAARLPATSGLPGVPA